MSSSFCVWTDSELRRLTLDGLFKILAAAKVHRIPYSYTLAIENSFITSKTIPTVHKSMNLCTVGISVGDIVEVPPPGAGILPFVLVVAEHLFAV